MEDKLKIDQKFYNISPFTLNKLLNDSDNIKTNLEEYLNGFSNNVEEHFFVDLVFYNRLLKCFVLINLKIGKLKHQDIGQMQMYVNYYDREIKLNDENKTIGIIICNDKKDTLVEMTLPKDNEQIFASKYMTILPLKEELKKIV